MGKQIVNVCDFFARVLASTACACGPSQFQVLELPAGLSNKISSRTVLFPVNLPITASRHV
jgi:hypothetical protein